MNGIQICFFTLAIFIIANNALWELQLELEDSHFDHIVFTQFWAPEACKSLGKECKFANVSSNWTIHGTWPTIGETHGPIDCTNEPFHQNLLTAEMLKFMNDHWITFVKNQTNPCFWEHEWSKHGTCAVDGDKTQFPDQKSYFTKSIQLYDKYNISAILLKSGIVPGMSRPQGDFLKAFKTSGIAEIVRLGCNKHNLLSIEICFDNSLQLINCTNPTGCSTSADINYQPF